MSESYEQLFENWRLRCEALEAIIQRLQNLQPKDITPEELQAVNEESHCMPTSYLIAAVCRGMLREGKGNE